MSELPESTRLYGTGIFRAGEVDAHAKFEIVWNPQYASVIITDLPLETKLPLGWNADSWTLSGILSDGRSVECRAMLATHARLRDSRWRAEFLPSKGLEIGSCSPGAPTSVQYQLVGLFKGRLDTSIDGWTMRLVGSLEDGEGRSKVSRAWGVPLEGLCLGLSHCSAGLPEYDKKARAVCKLLSLAVGNGVAFQKMSANWENRSGFERWRRQTGDKIGPGPVYPYEDFSLYLEQSLPAWESWEQERQDVFQRAVEYINLSHTGYLDTRTFQIMQVWEFIADTWGPKVTLSAPVQELRRCVKQTCKEWRRRFPGADPDGHWPDRLTFPFDWQLAKTSILQYCRSLGLDLASLGVDLDRLKTARDSVAHTGKLPEDMRSDTRKSVDLLLRAQRAMQLVLLLELGYAGSVRVRTLSEERLIDLPMIVSGEGETSPSDGGERGHGARQQGLKEKKGKAAADKVFRGD